MPATKIARKSVAPAARKSAKRSGSKASAHENLMRDLAQLYDADGTRLTATQRADVEEWALGKIGPNYRKALAATAIALVTHKLEPPEQPVAPITIEQERDVLARRLTNAGEAVDEVELAQLAEMFEAVRTLALEYEHLDDDGPGERTKQRAVIAGIAALGDSGAKRLIEVYEAIDKLRLYKGAEVTPEDLTELETATGSAA